MAGTLHLTMEPTTTSTPRIPQNSASCGSSGNPPRSQNHWYECSSQVATNTMSVDDDQRRGSAAAPQPEEAGVVHQLHHEVLPVDVDAAPEIGEARRQVIEVMRFRQAETEQVQYPDDQVELAGHAQVEQERCQA